MSVKISGVMKDAMGKPIPDCTIALKALHTSATVITKTIGSLQPEENGSYSMDVELGKYSVTLCVEGYPPNDVGEIYVHSESAPGTLNYYLGLPTEGDFPPAAIQQFEAMVALVSKQAAQVEKDKAAAAKSAADALASQAAAKASENSADSSAKAAKLSEANADKSQKAAEQSANKAQASQEAAQLSETAASSSQASATKSASEALASQMAANTSETNAQQSAGAAAALVSEKAAKTSETNTAKGIEAAAASAQAAKLSETNADGSKKAAQASATEALASQGAAKTSETNAGNSAKATSGSADKAKSEADRATAATDGKQDENALLTAIAALNTDADQIITLTGKNSVATAVLTKFAKEMFAKTDADGVREYLCLKEALIRGDYGFGATHSPVIGGSNASGNSVTEPNGMYSALADYNDLGTAWDIAGQAVGLINLGMHPTASDKFKSQIATSYSTSGRMFFRCSLNATWRAWKEVMYNGYANPIFRGYVTQRNNSSMIREWHNEAVSQVAIGAKTQFHVNMAQGDDSAVSEFLLVRRNGTNTTGQIVVTFPKTGGTIALQGTSGIDFKKDIDDAEPQDALDRINALRLVNYIYKDDKEESIRFGIIAEEAEKIAPQYIKHNKEYVDDVLDPITNEVIDKIYRDRPSVDVNPIVMDLLGAIQVLNSKLNEQETKLLALEKTISSK